MRELEVNIATDSGPVVGAALSADVVDPTACNGYQTAPRTVRVKSIPPDERKQRPGYFSETIWYRRLIRRAYEDTQFQRSAVQLAFTLLCVWIGLEFYLFVRWGMSGGQETFFPRPPGVEGFLPISALISLKYWLDTGIINHIHPSGLFILMAILASSLLLKKAFCSWLCPIGTLSESLWMLGRRVLGRNLRLPRWLDYPLRLLKYFLLIFFLWSIWTMDVAALKAFIYSPYNRMADVKMYLFFAQISSVAFWTIAVLVLLSLAIKSFWCRYLCPYGALLGIASWLSPLKITRNTASCIDCELCTKVCPSGIEIHTLKRVWSDECMACLQCVDACPVRNTLEMRTRISKRGIPGWVFASLVVGIFVAVTGLAMLTDQWQNRIHPQEYERRFQEIDAPKYRHMRGEVTRYGPND